MKLLYVQQSSTKTVPDVPLQSQDKRNNQSTNQSRNPNQPKKTRTTEKAQIKHKASTTTLFFGVVVSHIAALWLRSNDDLQDLKIPRLYIGPLRFAFVTNHTYARRRGEVSYCGSPIPFSLLGREGFDEISLF